MIKKYKCKLCGNEFDYSQMSDEHYPAKCVGNNDIVKFDITKALDLGMSGEIIEKIKSRSDGKKSIEEIMGDIFDEELAIPLYPKGRTSRTLCINCNKLLGRYDEAYKKFYDSVGEPKVVKGFTKETKLKIIKSIYGKFLSVPEAANEMFDFVDFVRNDEIKEYNGKWQIYFVKRDYSTDLMGFKDIDTGSLKFDDGMLYELTDENFIYDLTTIYTKYNNEMNNIFDILSNDYKLISGVSEYGGYHGQIVMLRAFSGFKDIEKQI